MKGKNTFPNVKVNDIPLYGVWCVMKQRCYNPKDQQYKYYGARGITVCSIWKKDFLAFYNWALEHGYKKGLTIERNNNDLGYSPDNCRLATKKEQMRNRRITIKVLYNGEYIPLTQVCELLNITRREAQKRYGTLKKDNRNS